MLKFIFRALCGAPVWLLYFTLMLPLQLIGYPLVLALALYVQRQSKHWTLERSGALHFPKVLGFRLFWLWDNDEDGIDGDPLPDGPHGEPKNPAWFDATANWPVWRRIFVWSAWRNSVGNARRLPLFGLDIKDPKDVVVYLPPQAWSDRAKSEYKRTYDQWWSEYRKLGPYTARYGWAWELRFPWPVWYCSAGTMCVPCNANRRFFWIGWRIAQQDSPQKDVGFACQFFGKL